VSVTVNSTKAKPIDPGECKNGRHKGIPLPAPTDYRFVARGGLRGQNTTYDSRKPLKRTLKNTRKFFNLKKYLEAANFAKKIA